ncbi:hypothetical protein ABPG73_000829 [Tetrahymena malaccensis]
MNRFENLPGIKEFIANPTINLKVFLPPFKATWSAFQKGEVFLQQLTDFLGGKKFLLNSLTLADFLFYEALTYYKALHPKSVTQRHLEYMNEFESLPGIKQYVTYASQNINSFLLNQKQSQQTSSL